MQHPWLREKRRDRVKGKLEEEGTERERSKRTERKGGRQREGDKGDGVKFLGWARR